MSSILIAVIHGPYEPWLSILRDGQMQTWIKQENEVDVVNVFGKPINKFKKEIDQKLYFLRWNRNKVLAYSSLLVEAFLKKLIRLEKYKPKSIEKVSSEFGIVWEVQMPDSLLLQGVKNLSVLREFLKKDYEYLVTTITSSYVNVPKLKAYLSENKSTHFAGGRIEKSGEMDYQQGSFRVYSREVVLELVKNSKHYQHWKIEDIAMGKLVNSLGFQVTPMPNITLNTRSDILKLTHKELHETISYRCKSQQGEIRFDSQIMKELHNLLTH